MHRKYRRAEKVVRVQSYSDSLEKMRIFKASQLFRFHANERIGR